MFKTKRLTDLYNTYVHISILISNQAPPLPRLSMKESSNLKINKWNIQEVRVTFDDLVVKFLNEEAGFKEDNFLILLKLVVYFILNFIGVSTGLYGYYTKPFSSTRLLVFIGSSIYLLANGIWSLLLQYHIAQTIYRGRDKNGKSIWIRSTIKYPQGVYKLELLKVGTKNSIGSPFEIDVGQWIDVDGNVLEGKLQEDLKSKLVPKFKLE